MRWRIISGLILGKARLNGIGVDKKHVTLETSDRMLEILNGINA